jgi:hypothetical protein
MIEDTLWFDSAGEYTRRCRRFGADRIDCEVRLYLPPRNDHCRRIVAITRLPTGQTRWGRYRCPRRRESLFDRDMRRGQERPGRRSSKGGSTLRA